MSPAISFVHSVVRINRNRFIPRASMDRFPLREEKRLLCPAESPLLTHMWQVVARDWRGFFQ